MKRINKLTEIPSWFKHSNYEELENFNNKQWYEELDFRHDIQIFLNAMKLDPNADNFDRIKSVVESYIYQISRAPTKPKRENLFGVYDLHEAAIDKCTNKSELATVDIFQRAGKINNEIKRFLINHHYSFPSSIDNPIRELSIFSAGRLIDTANEMYGDMYKSICENIKRDFVASERKIAENSLDMFFKEVSLGSYFWSAAQNPDNEYPDLDVLSEAGSNENHEYLAVDLSVDEDILVKEFKRKVQALKKQRHFERKTHKASETKLKNIYLHKVLQYLDLKNWADYHGMTIENNLMNQVLFPNNECHVGITKETAKKVLSPRFIQSINIL